MQKSYVVKLQPQSLRVLLSFSNNMDLWLDIQCMKKKRKGPGQVYIYYPWNWLSNQNPECRSFCCELVFGYKPYQESAKAFRNYTGTVTTVVKGNWAHRHPLSLGSWFEVERCKMFIALIEFCRSKESCNAENMHEVVKLYFKPQCLRAANPATPSSLIFTPCIPTLANLRCARMKWPFCGLNLNLQTSPL